MGFESHDFSSLGKKLAYLIKLPLSLKNTYSAYGGKGKGLRLDFPQPVVTQGCC